MDKDEPLTERTVSFLLAQIVAIAYMARSLPSQEDVAKFAKSAAGKAAAAAHPILGQERVKEIIRDTAELCGKHVKEWNEEDTKEKN
jgi:hypothetical protein